MAEGDTTPIIHSGRSTSLLGWKFIFVSILSLSWWTAACKPTVHPNGRFQESHPGPSCCSGEKRYLLALSCPVKKRAALWREKTRKDFIPDSPGLGLHSVFLERGVRGWRAGADGRGLPREGEHGCPQGKGILTGHARHPAE